MPHKPNLSLQLFFFFFFFFLKEKEKPKSIQTKEDPFGRHLSHEEVKKHVGLRILQERKNIWRMAPNVGV
jgi:hypothetical protein